MQVSTINSGSTAAAGSPDSADMLGGSCDTSGLSCCRIVSSIPGRTIKGNAARVGGSGAPYSIWVRNIQLSLLGVVASALGALI